MNIPLFKKNTAKAGKPESQMSMKAGGYSIMLTAVVLALLVAVNVFASVLPSTMTRLDISASNLYSVTSQTKSVVNALNQDVTIYWICQAGKEDSVIENLLDKYSSLSDHIHVEKKNPDTYPAFAKEYTSEPVSNNSLVVVSGSRNRYIAYNKIYLTEADYTTKSYSSSFDGEGAITSAIGYVTTEKLPKLYLLEGHGEPTLPGKFAAQLTKENYETENLSILSTEAVPEDAAAVLIYAPTSDISEKEATVLGNYVKDGGKLVVLAGPAADDSMDHLYSLLSAYGISRQNGIITEADPDKYAFQSPYILLPTIEQSELTAPLINGKYHILVPLAQGMTIAKDAANVTPLLSTSENAYSKAAGFKMQTIEKEEGDVSGPFTIGLSVKNSKSGKIFWISSSVFLEDEYNSYSSGANLDLTMNAISSMVDTKAGVSIRSKSLSYNYLTISATTAAMMKLIMIGVLPLVCIILGITIQVMRRQKQEELYS